MNRPCAHGHPALHSAPPGRPGVPDVKPTSPGKTGYYVLEGLNSFATSYYFNYLMFLLQREHGFTNSNNLAVGAVHGFLYVGASWYAGRFGQRHGYFTSLRIGFAGMAASVALGWILPGAAGQIAALLCWTVTMCFTWPMLEALVAEHEPHDRLPRRLGLYNVTWAAAAAAGYFLGGSIFERLGRTSLYWLPVGIHVAQFFATWLLERRHDAWLATAPPVETWKPTEAELAGKPKYFQTLAWIGNPFAYMAANTLVAVVPGIAASAGLNIEQAGQLMALWYVVRTVTFAVLWHWKGWHYRFGWFAGAFLLLVAGFVSVMTTSQVWVLVAGQVAFGWATGLLYYSSLFYALDGSDTQGEHGGIHEAFIGLGIGTGPAISTLALWLTGAAAAPAVAVGGTLLVGLGASVAVWRRGRTAAVAALSRN